ncbi:long-chain fatty acid--CoA ligase [Mycolicibacterium sp. 018/SC-01/001]|uniref:class I adenylate-forming enzyme family protein n=1 Tax=Mycolicibacterium sp. 018/SC-01/001 TaxID=2592069 RepID=UPI00117D57D1|nr:fatty acid--CoA ligase family protein [Mycolicibacterium sp. 018/SC-01/001]TRW79643.1 long-chain fatty acid--CoA ligase [Mycolicibacterium sp. 018/SC-01/001]
MSISLLLDMAASAAPERLAVVSRDGPVEQRLSTGDLQQRSAAGAGVVTARGAQHLVYVGVGGATMPLLIFSAAAAGVPFTPINYRLSADGIAELIARLPDPLVIVDPRYRDIVGTSATRVLTVAEFHAAAAAAEPAVSFADADDVAVVLFTSGTTAAPKAVELTHHNLTSYITGTVEFASAGATDAALICVPPYHVAGVGAALSNLYAGRRMVYLPTFDADEWVRLVDAEKITTATVVPTMLDRLVDALERSRATLPSLQTLAYGGSRVALPLVRRAIELLPDVGFVNAYGLTETSSTIAVLTPDDHRAAFQATDPAAAARLGSVGRPVPGIELQIRDATGTVLGPGERGELFVRGDQVSGRYTGIGSVLDADGWFPTRDIAMLDSEGFLFIGGRSDDTIIRGGENIAPAELEDVLVEHPGVREVAVVGVDDDHWGQIIVAVVVPSTSPPPEAEHLRDHVRRTLRGSRTPDRVVFRANLPTNATGKVLRRELVADLQEAT